MWTVCEIQGLIMRACSLDRIHYADSLRHQMGEKDVHDTRTKDMLILRASFRVFCSRKDTSR